ncbi:hypothetical protein [Rhizobium leguminosarum]|uniref:hypothetical protein n=1 Tax=Rhizobium leguminosarum TaxID=384 RepID=UPI001C912AB8|nr:hypothetical protein [Rhizobium leguminosarum]MBY3043709.1 hypothetical protein [Rhizobium leguminosarum]
MIWSRLIFARGVLYLSRCLLKVGETIVDEQMTRAAIEVGVEQPGRSYLQGDFFRA